MTVSPFSVRFRHLCIALAGCFALSIAVGCGDPEPPEQDDNQAGEDCEVDCDIGASRCDGDEVQYCVEADGCPIWSEGIECEDGCVDGRCETECEDECYSGTRQCEGDGAFRICQVQADGCLGWSESVDCEDETVCSDGACVPDDECVDACDEEDATCVGDEVLVCEIQDSGCLDWSSGPTCDSDEVCRDGGCVEECSDACLGGQTRCVDEGVEYCQMKADGCYDWSESVECPDETVCSDGVCKEPLPDHPECSLSVDEPGGTAPGDPVDGIVEVTVCSHNHEKPLEDAFVMLGTDPEDGLYGLTDDGGTIEFSSDDLDGPQTVTATAYDYSSTMFADVDADEVTMFLRTEASSGSPPPPPPVAEVEGEISGFDALDDDLGVDEHRVAVVETTRESIGGFVPDPGDDNIVYFDEQDAPYSYTLQTRTGQLAVVVLAGIYDEETEEFVPELMGVRRGLVAAEDGEYDVDLELDIELDGSFELEWVDPPLEPGAEGTNRAETYFDFGDDGIFEPDNALETTSDEDVAAIEALPGDSTPETDDLTVSVLAQNVEAGESIPVSQFFLGEIDVFDDLDEPVSTPPLASFIDVTQPEAGESPDGGLVEWELTGANDPNLSLFRVATFMQQTVWKVYVDGEATEFQFPEFPDFDQFDFGTDEGGDPVEPIPYPGGTYQVFCSGLAEPSDLEIDDFHYNEIYQYDGLRNFSMNGVQMGLPTDWSDGDSGD